MRTERILVGDYDLGGRRVWLYGTPADTGGSFTVDGPGGRAEIKIGFKSKNWTETVSWLFHEALEFVLADCGARYAPSPDYAGDSAGWMFCMDHTKFGESVARAAYFLAGSLPDLAKEWRKGKRP